MSDAKISALPSAATLTGAERLPVSQSNQTRGATAAQLLSSSLFTQSGTGAVARSINSKFGDIVSVKDFNAAGDGVTDDTAAIQAAIDAVQEGGTVLVPASSAHYLYTILTISKTITIQGQGWHCPTLGTFGDSGYLSATLGSVLRSTKTTAGNSIVSQTINKNPAFKDIAVIGPGSGTSTGIGFGDGSNYQIRGKWSNVLIANFYVGLPLTNVEDYEFSSLRIRGCSTDGLLLQSGIAGTNTNQNTFIQLEIQKCGTGLHVTEASTAVFLGGLIQGNTTGMNIAPSANGRIAALYFDGFWFESNTTPRTLDLTNGGVQHLAFSRCTMQETSNLFSLTNPNNNILSYLNLENCDGAGTTVDLSPGVSVGPAFSQVVIGGGNNFLAYTYSNATVINLSGGQIKSTVSILPPLSTGSAVWAMDGNQTGASIANNGTATPFGNSNNFSGMFWINDTNSGSGAIFITGNGVMTLVSQTGTTYTVTSGSAAKINVYLVGNVVTVENKLGATTEARIIAFRTRASQ